MRFIAALLLLFAVTTPAAAQPAEPREPPIIASCASGPRSKRERPA